MAYPQRRTLRLRGYDYAQPGAYFVTICTRERACPLGDVVNGEMALNDYGWVVESCWQALPRHFPHVRLDAFVVMPNHVHGVIVITDFLPRSRSGRGEAFCDFKNASPLQGTQPGSLGAVVQNFKSVTTRRINAMRGTPGTSVWQRNYYEHVIRDEVALNRIRQYIVGNPARWSEDAENPVEAGFKPAPPM